MEIRQPSSGDVAFKKLCLKVDRLLLMAHSPVQEIFRRKNVTKNSVVYKPVQVSEVLNTHICYFCYQFLYDPAERKSSKVIQEVHPAMDPRRITNLRSAYNPQYQTR